MISDEKEIIKKIKQAIRDRLRKARRKTLSKGNNLPAVNVVSSRNVSKGTVHTGRTTYNPTKTLHPRMSPLIHQHIDPKSQFRHDDSISDICNPFADTIAVASPQYNSSTVEQSQSILIQKDYNIDTNTKNMYQKPRSDYLEIPDQPLEIAKQKVGVDLNKSVLLESLNSSSITSTTFLRIPEEAKYYKKMMREFGFEDSFFTFRMDNFNDLNSFKSYESDDLADNIDVLNQTSLQTNETFTPGDDTIHGLLSDTVVTQPEPLLSNTSPITHGFSNRTLWQLSDEDLCSLYTSLTILEGSISSELESSIMSGLYNNSVLSKTADSNMNSIEIMSVSVGSTQLPSLDGDCKSRELEDSIVWDLENGVLSRKTVWCNVKDATNNGKTITNESDVSDSFDTLGMDHSIEIPNLVSFESHASIDNNDSRNQRSFSPAKELFTSDDTIQGVPSVTDVTQPERSQSNTSPITPRVSNRIKRITSGDVMFLQPPSLYLPAEADRNDNHTSLSRSDHDIWSDNSLSVLSLDLTKTDTTDCRQNVVIIPKQNGDTEHIEDNSIVCSNIANVINCRETDGGLHNCSRVSRHSTFLAYNTCLGLTQMLFLDGDSKSSEFDDSIIISKHNGDKERIEHNSVVYSDIGTGRDSIEIEFGLHNSSMSIKTFDVSSIQNMSGSIQQPFLDGDSKSSGFDDSIVFSLDNSAIRSKTREPTEQYCDTTNFIQHNNMSDSLHLSSLIIYSKR